MLKYPFLFWSDIFLHIVHVCCILNSPILADINHCNRFIVPHYTFLFQQHHSLQFIPRPGNRQCRLCRRCGFQTKYQQLLFCRLLQLTFNILRGGCSRVPGSCLHAFSTFCWSLKPLPLRRRGLQGSMMRLSVVSKKILLMQLCLIYGNADR